MFRPLKVLWLSTLSIFIGLRVTIKNFFAPAVTLQYPSEKKTMAENFRGMVDLIPPACVICYQCIRICPTSALYLSHKQSLTEDNKKKLEITSFTYNAELCCFCGLCEEICPTDAIYLNKMYEVSTYNHNDVLSIDLMDPAKYKHVDAEYNMDKYMKAKVRK